MEHEYLIELLQKGEYIGSGLGRIVIGIDDETVIKIAYNTFGELKNAEERKYYKIIDSNEQKYFPKTNSIWDSNMGDSTLGKDVFIRQERLQGLNNIYGFQTEYEKCLNKIEKEISAYAKKELNVKNVVGKSKDKKLKIIDFGMRKGSSLEKRWREIWEDSTEEKKEKYINLMAVKKENVQFLENRDFYEHYKYYKPLVEFTMANFSEMSYSEFGKRLLQIGNVH